MALVRGDKRAEQKQARTWAADGSLVVWASGCAAGSAVAVKTDENKASQKILVCIMAERFRQGIQGCTGKWTCRVSLE